MAVATEGSIPCLHALALGLFERSQVMAGQTEFIMDTTLGPRPHRDAPRPPASIYDCLAKAMQTFNQIHDDLEIVSRHMVPSDDMLKEEAALRGPQPGEPIAVDRPVDAGFRP